MNKKALSIILAITFTLSALTGCGIIRPQSTEKPPETRETKPLTGEFVTEGGSKLTFVEDGVSDYWDTGYVLVEFAADAQYLLEGRENNTTYRYVFSKHNLPAPYDVADDFQLSTGEEWFANCQSIYTAYGDLLLDPYILEGDELMFEYVKTPSKGVRYDLVPGDGNNPYYKVEKKQIEEE